MNAWERQRALLKDKGLLGRASGFRPPQEPVRPAHEPSKDPDCLTVVVYGTCGGISYHRLGPDGYRRIGKS